MAGHIGLYLDPDTHDFELTDNGNLKTVADNEAIGQHVDQRLKTFHGEWFLDNEAGVKWLDDVLGGKPNLPIAEALTKAEILDTDGVTGISEYASNFNLSRRELDVTRLLLETEYD